MNAIIKILYINFLTSGRDRETKIRGIYWRGVNQNNFEPFEEAAELYKKYSTGISKLVPIKRS